MARNRVKTSLAFSEDWRSFNGFYTTRGTITLVNSDSIIDDVHSGFKGSTGDSGGNMTHLKTRYSLAPCHFDNPYVTAPQLPQHMYVDDTGLGGSYPSELTLLSQGATAIARVLPTNPAFEAAQAIGELRSDGLPRLPGAALREKSKYLKNSGNEYLNAEFGWAPLMNDLKKFAHAVKGSHKILEQYRKGSDSKIRRRYYFPPETASKTWRTGDPGAGQAVAYGDIGALDIAGSLGNGIQTSTRSSRTWFSGAFRYHIPMGDSTPEKFARWSSYADKLLGVKPTPEVLWELQPWSWAVDWFSNTGDVLHNISRLGLDGLVMQYGYIMSEQKYTRELSAQFPINSGAWCSTKYEETRQVRRGASPYGFGFNMATLTASQDAVLVALGLSKGLR